MSNRITDSNEMVLVLFEDADDAATQATGGAGYDPNIKFGVTHDLQDDSGAFALIASDVCDRTKNHLLAGTVDASPKIYQVEAFGGEVGAKRNIRCANGEEQQIVESLLGEGAIDAVTEYVLWNGLPNWDANLQPFLLNNDVQTVASAAAPQDTIAAAVIKHAALTVSKNLVVHMGVKVALDLSATGYAYNDGPDPRTNSLRLRAIDAPIVVSPYYPDTGIAITGPIVIRVGSASSWQQYDYTTNKTAVRGYRTFMIDFDPSTAVRAA